MVSEPIDVLLSDNGPLAAVIAGFRARGVQQRLANAIAEAIQGAHILVAEAGTGTGKTFAYLLPAILSGRQVVISTGTKSLQDQLYFRDLPKIQKALSQTLDIALLKGRNNYLCRHRLSKHLETPEQFSKTQLEEMEAVQTFANTHQSGDLTQCEGMHEHSSIRALVTSTADNCLGQDCAHYSNCFLVKARIKAQKARIIVVNHHLLAADFCLKEGGFGELLPSPDLFIVDEAHQLPEVLTNFFGTSLSSRQVHYLLRDLKSAALVHEKAWFSDCKAYDSLQEALIDFVLSFSNLPSKGAWSQIENITNINIALEDLKSKLDALRSAIILLDSQSQEIPQFIERCSKLLATLNEIMNSNTRETVKWYEKFKESCQITLTPLSVADQFAPIVSESNKTWIFTSATLAVKGNFDFFIENLGLDKPETLQLESPFDYRKNALLYLPRGLPWPNTSEYTEAVVRAALPVLTMSAGRAFFLFTSFRALERAAEYLEALTDFTLLIQGTQPKGSLIEAFLEKERAILLGTATFWEGIDIKGENLSLVIIDKLPFGVPSDPVMQAKAEAIHAKGEDPFRQLQLPSAALDLKQGAGRLIRDANDQGVLMICDPRLPTQAYAKIFFQSLPPMARTRDLNKVKEFFNEILIHRECL